MKRSVAIPVVFCLLALGACGRNEVDAPPAEAELEIVGTTWQWQEFQDSADGDEANHISVGDPAKYTLTLKAGNKVEILADCNQVSWQYSLAGSRLTFDSIGPSTLAACGEASLDQPYLKHLGHTATYVFADGKLHLNLKADAGNMVFVPAK